MKLLICTQVIDKNHAILGFFHRWVEEFAKHCEVVHVICLYEGEHSLPSHVHVHSLGKEKGESRVKYLLRFYSFIWKLHKEYDSVFVHMNQVYVILGALLWRGLGKKIGLWYAHGKVSISLRIAVKLAHVVFTSTEQGLQLSTPKRRIVGQGIDLEHFAYKKKTSQDQVLKLVTVGRISPSKNIGTLLDACTLLKNKNVPFTFSIVGAAFTDAEKEYERAMHQKADRQGLADHLMWVGGVPQTDLPQKLQEADIFIHDGATQSLDKALLEAVACGCIVISSNPSYEELSSPYAPQYLFESKNAQELSDIVESIAQLSIEERETSMDMLRVVLHEQHGINGLISRIIYCL